MCWAQRPQNAPKTETLCGFSTLTEPLVVNTCNYFVSVHVLTILGRGAPRRFVQFLRALIAAHLNRLAADLDLDGIHIQLAVASRTGFLSHNIVLFDDVDSLNTGNPGVISRSRRKERPLSKSLAICLGRS